MKRDDSAENEDCVLDIDDESGVMYREKSTTLRSVFCHTDTTGKRYNKTRKTVTDCSTGGNLSEQPTILPVIPEPSSTTSSYKSCG